MWLLGDDAAAEFKKILSQDLTITTDHIEAFNSAAQSDSVKGLTTVGNSAEIAVEGLLTRKRNFRAAFFGPGNTTYPDIISALAHADSDPSIDNIILAIDSPGGEVAGLFEVFAAINTTKTPVKAVIRNMAASAAYGIAAQADTVEAVNSSARIGSIGVAISMFNDKEIIDIASSKAPKKRPDINTDKGVKVIQSQLDDMHELFVNAIAAGRGISTDKVDKDFGQGSTFLADGALKAGMIDAVQSVPSTLEKTNKQTALIGKTTQETNTMDLNTFKASHPAVYQAAVAEGVAKERDRVTAHTVMGEGSGDMKTAIAAIKAGSEMTATLSATYQMAGINRQTMNARSDDDGDADAADESAPKDTTTEDEKKAEAVMSAVETMCGVEKGEK